MMRRNVIIAIIAVAVISGLILFGPGMEKKAPETLVFDTAWDVIDYKIVPEEFEKTQIEADEKAKKEKNYNPKDRETQRARDKDNTLPKRFIRDAGFFTDAYFVESNDSAGNPVRRRGGYTVKNIFSDWSKLRYTALYPVADQDAGKFGPYTDIIELKRSGKSTIVRIGKKHTSGNQFIRVEHPDHKNRVYLVQGFLSDRFRANPFSFREKRIVNYPNDSYTEKLGLQMRAGDKMNFRAEKTMKDNMPIFKWYDQKGTELPVNLITPMDNVAKLIEISRFRDEPEVQSYGNPDTLWAQLNADDANIEIKVKGGDSYVIRVRRPNLSITDGTRKLALIQTSLEPGTDYADLSSLENLERQVQMMRMSMSKTPNMPNPNGQQSGPTTGQPGK